MATHRTVEAVISHTKPDYETTVVPTTPFLRSLYIKQCVYLKVLGGILPRSLIIGLIAVFDSFLRVKYTHMVKHVFAYPVYISAKQIVAQIATRNAKRIYVAILDLIRVNAMANPRTTLTQVQASVNQLRHIMVQIQTSNHSLQTAKRDMQSAIRQLQHVVVQLSIVAWASTWQPRVELSHEER